MFRPPGHSVVTIFRRPGAFLNAIVAPPAAILFVAFLLNVCTMRLNPCQGCDQLASHESLSTTAMKEPMFQCFGKLVFELLYVLQLLDHRYTDMHPLTKQE